MLSCESLQKFQEKMLPEFSFPCHEDGKKHIPSYFGKFDTNFTVLLASKHNTCQKAL
jgi:hypothetical protein